MCVAKTGRLANDYPRLQLPPRELRILQLRYGLLDGKAHTPEEVGRFIGVTRERARRIEAQSMSWLITNWPIILDALRKLWKMGMSPHCKACFMNH
jgi:hypothetical protein